MTRRNSIIIKSPQEIKIMAEGGKRLAAIKDKLIETIDEGVKASEIEALANRLIKKTGGKPSFKMVEGYKWATCVNINEGVVHGIPDRSLVFKKGDLVSVDIGLYFRGFHTDASFTVGISLSEKTEKFLEVGKIALKRAIKKACFGNKIYDISKTIEETLKKEGLSPIKSLVGHGVGRNLHEDPQIPCFVSGSKEKSPRIPIGAVLAIEIMYTQGSPDVKVGKDGWTIETKDGKIAGLFEETVAVTRDGPLILTNGN
jgi:methionyl aminopeptidase